MKIEERVVEIDVVNNPMFQWSETLNLPAGVDWNQLQFQNIYKTPDYVASKFTGDFSHLSGFDKIIENIAVKTTTPFEELLNMSKPNLLQLYDYCFDKPYQHLDIDTKENKIYKNFNLLQIQR